MLREATTTAKVEAGRPAWAAELAEVFKRLDTREAALVLVFSELEVVDGALAGELRAQLRDQVGGRQAAESFNHEAEDRAEVSFVLGLLAGLEAFSRASDAA